MQRELRNLWVTWLKFTVTKVSDDVGMEANIHWNGPPIHLAQNFGEAALDAHFGGRHKWHFVTRQDKKKKKTQWFYKEWKLTWQNYRFTTNM